MQPRPKKNPLNGWNKDKLQYPMDLHAKISESTICHRIRLMYIRASNRGDRTTMELCEQCWDMAKRMNDKLIWYRAKHGEVKEDAASD